MPLCSHSLRTRCLQALTHRQTDRETGCLAATLPGLTTLSTPCPAGGQRGGSPLKKAFFSLPLPMLFSLPQRSANSHLHGAPLHLPAITVLNQGEGQRQRRAPLAPPHLHPGWEWMVEGGRGRTRYICVYVWLGGGGGVNTACRCGMSALLLE